MEFEKRIKLVRQMTKNKKNYIGDIKSHKLYNIWRAIRFTDKGKKIGNDLSWNNYRTFYNDIIDIYEKDKRLIRINKSLPFSKTNCCFLSDEESANIKSNVIVLEYNGEKRTLKDWAYLLNQNLGGIKLRYHRHKNYSAEEILFGKKKNVKRKGVVQIENIRASKLCSSYRIKDKQRNRINDIDKDWFLKNISRKECFYCGDTKNIGLDRIDNNKGHTKDNVIPCCIECNIVRSDRFTVEEMLIIGETIKKIKELRELRYKKLMAEKDIEITIEDKK